ncbi:hypothetical protein D3C80_1959150 [compost metagenome]
MTIAHRGLRHLGNQCLGITQHQQQQFAVTVEFVLQALPGQAVGVAGALNDRAAGRAFSTHEHRDAHQAFVTHHRNFR